MDEFKKIVKHHLKRRGWDNGHPADIAKSIVIESAELLEIFQWDNTRSKRKIDNEQLSKVKEELADVLIYCFNMGMVLSLDLEKIVKDKLIKIDRKYPPRLFTKRNHLRKDTRKLYSNIKQSYRNESRS